MSVGTGVFWPWPATCGIGSVVLPAEQDSGGVGAPGYQLRVLYGRKVSDKSRLLSDQNLHMLSVLYLPLIILLKVTDLLIS